jgi:hypothetical protein
VPSALILFQACTRASSSFLLLTLLLHLELEIAILQDRPGLRWQQGTFWWLVRCFESVADRFHGYPLDAFEFVDVFDVAVEVVSTSVPRSLGGDTWTWRTYRSNIINP